MNLAAVLAGDRTVVAVLHDVNAAAMHANRILVMSGGAVVADGEPRHVLRGNLLTAVYNQPMVVVDHPFRDCPLVLTADG